MGTQRHTYSNVDGSFIDGLDDQAGLDDATGGLLAHLVQSRTNNTTVVVFVGVTGFPDC